MEYLFCILLGFAMGLIVGIRGTKITMRKTNEDIENDLINLMESKINEMVSKNKLHPLVVSVYNLFTSKDGVDKFRVGNCTISIPSMGIEIWKENGVDARRFYQLPTHIEVKFQKKRDEINESLSYADQKVLDVICKRVEVNNKEFIERLFIKNGNGTN